MTQTFDCGNQEALIDYLYDECNPAERSAIAAHLVMCGRCASEVAGLRATRAELPAWTPPTVHLGFRVVSEPAPSNVIRPARWWSRPVPAWQAAAAVLIFGVGVGLGALRGTVANTESATASATSVAPAAVTASELTALEQRLRAEIVQTRTTAAAAPAVSSHTTATADAAAASSAAMLQQVRQLIRDSEVRQQRELQLRTAEVIRDFDTQRRGDLARIEQTFGRMEGTTGARVEQQQQMLNYLMRVSQPQR